MIDFGIDAYGPELGHRPISEQIRALRSALAPERDAILDVIFAIPGSLGEPDFEGFLFWHVRRPKRRLVVAVRVPRNVAESSQPMPSLIALARSAVAYARASVKDKDAQTIDFDAILAQLSKAATALTGSDEAMSIPPDEVPAIADPSPPETGASVIVSLDVSAGRSAMDAAFRLEQELADRLDDSDVGSVDGNEIGGGTFEIFAYGPSATELRNAIDPLVRTQWPDASIRIIEYGDESED